MIPSLTTNQASSSSAAPRPARVPPSARPRPPTLPSDHRSVTVGPVQHIVGGRLKQVVEIRDFHRLTSSPADTVITAPLTGELSSFCLKVYPAGKGASTTSHVSAFLCLNTEETSHEIVLRDLWLSVENSDVHKKLGDRKFGTTQARQPNRSSARLEGGRISGLKAKPSHGVLLFLPHSQCVWVAEWLSGLVLTRSGSLRIEVVANANIEREVPPLLPIPSLHTPETRRGPRLRRSVSSPCLSRMRVECPVCLDRVRPPMRLLQCDQGHVVCTLCYTQMVQKNCPTCRGRITGKPTVLENILGLA